MHDELTFFAPPSSAAGGPMDGLLLVAGRDDGIDYLRLDAFG